jgi:prepilin-type N-terminal cleavage/methylation domain-containing protein
VAGRIASPEAGFTLIEVLLAAALFAFVALAGFEVVRQLGATTAVLAQRAAAAAQLSVTASSLRSDALSSVAVWKAPSTCGDALEFMQHDAGGISFLLYVARGGNLQRATAAAPLDPCATNLQLQTVVPAVANFSVTTIAPADLPAHADSVSGNVDGGVFVPGGITAVAADAHVLDIDGTPVRSGNTVVEVTIDADPVRTVVDLVAGNRPSAYTQVLVYTCNGRCEATGAFPEARNAALTDCMPGYDFQNTSAYYVPASYSSVGAGNGKARIVVTSYSVTGGYTFAFSGPAPANAERVWPVSTWPAPGSALAGTIADAYPVDYTNNSVLARGPAQLAADLGEPAAFAAELTACADMHADPTYAG